MKFIQTLTNVQAETGIYFIVLTYSLQAVGGLVIMLAKQLELESTGYFNWKTCQFLNTGYK